jgi:cytochrome P450
MGQELYRQEPAFRATVQECARFVSSQGGPNLLEQFEDKPETGYLTEERRIYSLMVVQLALVDLWRAKGVEPDAFMGISVGEAAAIYGAGGFTLHDALRTAIAGVVASTLEPVHSVLIIAATHEQASNLAGRCPVPLFVAAAAEAQRCYVVCAGADVSAARAYLRQQGVSCHELRSAPPLPPYHTSLLTRHLAVLRPPLVAMQPAPLARPCYLATLGRLVPPGTILDSTYSLLTLQYPSQIHAIIQAARQDGYQLFTSLGTYPFPFMNGRAQQASMGGIELLTMLNPDTPETATFAALQQQLAGHGLVRPTALARPQLSLAELLAKLSLKDPEFIDNPHPTFDFLRRHGKLHFLPAEQAWLVLDAELVNEVLRQPLVFSSTVNADFDDQLVGADPPLHTGNRTSAQPYFMPMKLAAMADYTTATVAELAAGLEGRPSFDFVAEFAIPLAQAVGGQLLGLTRAEQADLLSRLPGHAYSLEYLSELNQYFIEYFEHRQIPAEPVLLDQFLRRVQQGELTMPAALNLAKTMWLAGIATSSMLMGSAAHYLLTYPAVADELRAQPELVEAFVEEMLRLEPPVNFIWRSTTQPTTLGGHELPTGSLVVLAIAAANRDPARLPNPDELDLRRRPVRHLAFGGGIHACMGAHLARLEVRIMVRWLLAQGPALRLTLPSILPGYYPNLYFRALANLPLTLQPPVPADVR